MENKITLSRLGALLALATGEQKELCDNFLRELFSIVTEEVSRGGNVRIKGFGTFKIVEVDARRSVNVATGEAHEIPPHSKLIFVPAKELASIANTPFNVFEAVEVADDIPTDSLDGDIEEMEPDNDEEAGREEETEKDESLPEEENVAEEESVTEEEELSAVSEEEPRCVEEIPVKRYRFLLGFLSGLVTAAVVGGIIFFLSGGCRLYAGAAENEEEENEAVVLSEGDPAAAVMNDSDTIISADLAEDVPTQPSDAVVYDTISTTRYLTTMAKEHYGNFNLWPIIYEENQSKLGHPDRIKPGTPVVVPPLSKYGIDPQNASQVKEVKERGRKIYAKFK